MKNHTEQETLQKIINAHDEIIAQVKKFSKKFMKAYIGGNTHNPVNNFSQNIENLAYYETISKTILDDNFDIFFKKYWKNNLETSIIINAQYQIRSHSQASIIEVVRLSVT